MHVWQTIKLGGTGSWVVTLSDESVSTVSRRRRILSLTVATGAVLSIGALVFTMPESQAEFWFGRTVEHCPNSEFSCPSQTLGVAGFAMLLVFPLLIYLEGNDDE